MPYILAMFNKNMEVNMKQNDTYKLLILFLGLMLSSSALFAGGSGSSSKPLAGSYPIVLNHGFIGWGESDSTGVIGIASYWGGMDDYLRSEGATVYAPQIPAVNSSELRAQHLKNKLLYYMAANGYSKVHIMGHSQGGVDARYMITNLGMKSKVSTLTSINSPHKGTPLADMALSLIPNWLKGAVNTILNALASVIYNDSEQDFIDSLASLTVSNMRAYNASTPNASGVKYFSYGSYMTFPDPVQHPVMFIPNPVLAIGGSIAGLGSRNDGIVPYESMKWGTWKGTPSTRWYTTGVDHMEVINALHSGQAWFDVEGHFLNMAKNAKNNQ